MGLTWSIYQAQSAQVLALTGDLTQNTVHQLEVQLAQLLTVGGTVLVIDLADVRACDHAGMAMLEGCRRAAVVAGVDMRLAAPSPAAAIALRSGGLMDTIAVFRTVDAAARGDLVERLPSRPPAG
jgi:anti-anti-sigma factor